MYIYELGFGSCEESRYWQLYHEKQYSEKQFDRIVLECLKETIRKLADAKRIRHVDRVWMDKDGPNFSELLNSKVFRNAILARGFTLVKFEAGCYMFGWASAIKKGDWKEYSSERTQRFQRSLVRMCKKEDIYVECEAEIVRLPPDEKNKRVRRFKHIDGKRLRRGRGYSKKYRPYRVKKTVYRGFKRRRRRTKK